MASKSSVKSAKKGSKSTRASAAKKKSSKSKACEKCKCGERRTRLISKTGGREKRSPLVRFP